jgi:outer membrane receptor protein involved in Fe transport
MAHAQDARVHLEVTAAPLDRALNSLARQSGVQILFASDIASDKTAPALNGNYTVGEALALLLKGQELEAVERAPGVYLVRKAQPKPARAPAAKPTAAIAARRADPADPVEEVLVTGEKIARSLQDTTTSVAVVTSQQIEAESIRDMYDVFNRTANVTQTIGDSGYTIRGIRDSDGGGQAPLSTIYLDGAALPHDTTDSGPTSAWDLAQVEVLRGPQSTIQGQNALAGAVVLRTQDPTMYWDWRARVQASDPSDRNLAFAGGGPLVRDELAFRVSVEDRDFDGFVRNVTRNVQEDALDSTTARAKLLWIPQALPGLTAKLSYTWADRSGPYRWAFVDTNVPDYFDHRTNRSNYPNLTQTRSDAATLEVEYDLAGAWSLSSVSAWNRTDTHTRFDRDRIERDELYDNNQFEYDTRSQELRLRHRGQRLDGLIGLYWSRRDVQGVYDDVTNVPTPVPTIAALLQGAGFPAGTAITIANLYAQALPIIPVSYVAESSSRSQNKALFADGEWHMTERISVLGGVRYDREQYTQGADGLTGFTGIYPDPASFGAAGTPLYLAVAAINQGVAAMVAQAGVGSSTPSGTREFDALLPKAGVRYKWTDDLSLGFVVQRGYRSGGSSYNVARSQDFAYDPEYTWNYEASLRSQWLDDALSVNVNAYYVDWKDKQVVASFGLNAYDTHTVNAGSAHLYGFEVETSHRLNAAFDWYAAVGHTRTRFDEFKTLVDATVIDNSGQEFAFAPHWTLAAGTNLRFAEHWVANLNAGYRGGMRADASANALRVGSRTLVNAKFGYQHRDWSAYLFGKNLFDEKYTQYTWSTTSGVAVLGDPRVVGIGVEAHW